MKGAIGDGAAGAGPRGREARELLARRARFLSEASSTWRSSEGLTFISSWRVVRPFFKTVTNGDRVTFSRKVRDDGGRV